VVFIYLNTGAWLPLPDSRLRAQKEVDGMMGDIVHEDFSLLPALGPLGPHDLCISQPEVIVCSKCYMAFTTNVLREW
jgi:hypothetical protein